MAANDGAETLTTVTITRASTKNNHNNKDNDQSKGGKERSTVGGAACSRCFASREASCCAAGSKEGRRIAEVSSLVTAENVAELQREFAKRLYGLTVEEFVKVMSVCLAGRMHSIETRDCLSEMIELFKQVDVNGNGKMEWEEFTSYIVDSGSTVGVPLTPMKLPRKAMYQPGDTKEHGFPDADHCVERLVLLGLPCPSIALILKTSDTIRLMKRSVHKGQPGLIQECSLRYQESSSEAIGLSA